jgi:6-phosphofructo-2-kinase
LESTPEVSEPSSTSSSSVFAYRARLFAVFNLGEYRRNVTTAYRNHDFFRPDNETAMAIRTNCAKHALEDVVNWLEMGGGEVAVSTRISPALHCVRRQTIRLFRRFSMPRTRHTSVAE